MNEFGLDKAWSLGVGFISRQAANHAIILIGIGVVVPLVLQYAVVGGPTGMMNPATMGQDGLGAMAAMGGAGMLVVMVLNYILQTGSYFGSWRIGFGAGESLGGAIVYGLIAGVLIVVGFVLVGIVGIGLMQVSEIVGIILLMLVLLPLLVFLYTVMAALICVGMFLMFLIALAFGSSMREANPALDALGSGAVVILILLLVFALLFWLTARFSCATSAMADRKTFNPIVGLTESWRMTADAQWRILGYLALIGIVLVVLFFIFMMILGASMMGSIQAGEMPQMGVGMLIMTFILSIGLAYLAVLVPAGIYRALGGGAAPAEVFA